MITVPVRPTATFLTLIGKIERSCGELSDKKFDSFTNDLLREQLLAGTEALQALDSSLQLAGSQNATHFHQGILSAHKQEAPDLITTEFLDRIYRTVTSCSESITIEFRTGILEFYAKGETTSLFRTISPFLIEKRLTDLLEWTNYQLEKGELHPLLIGAIFHLLFIQISPYRYANHTVSLLSLWHILKNTNYELFQFQHLAVYLLKRSKDYFNAIRQAERTILGDWSTLNLWIGFFLEICSEALLNLKSSIRENLEQAQLTRVQQQIVSTVGTHGSATRERIARETSINLSTVKYNLGVLTERGYLERIGAGRTTNYRVKITPS